MALSFYGGSIVSASLREALAGNAKTFALYVLICYSRSEYIMV